MLRTNLSTRPFYNERAVRGTLGLCALLLLAVTAFNGFRAVSLHGREGELSVRATAARAEADRLRAEAQRLQAQVDPKELEVVAEAAREANDLIAQRTFSWVRLMTQVENTLPDGVRVTSFQPKVEGGVVTVSMVVEARTTEALAAFTEALEGESTFRNVLSLDQTWADDGLIDATVEGTYLPPAPVAADEADEAPHGAPAGGAP